MYVFMYTFMYTLTWQKCFFFSEGMAFFHKIGSWNFISLKNRNHGSDENNSKNCH